ncbi:hypothetical protein HDU99_005899 [Rhizoclosmatium hyalinum]|nr:hypothetical protein HDU99_005899 [Rhizoclosmatium hyalinum]
MKKKENLVLPILDELKHRAAWKWAQSKSKSAKDHHHNRLMRILFGGGNNTHSTALDRLSDAINLNLNLNNLNLSSLNLNTLMAPKPPAIPRRVVVIGVHGWFPGRLLRNITGTPTGTSQKFAEKMEQAVRMHFLDTTDTNLPPSSISSISLEGHGKVEDRVDKLHAQIMRPDSGYAKAIQDADTVLVAAHSQGCPVSVMLFARLVREGFIDPSRQRVCLLLMAGISHGPFPHLKSSVVLKVEADAARQLFDFNDPTASITKRYHAAISQVLNAGIRICCVGSWYDQVVPLYSAVLHAFNHPSIFRAIHIDGADYSPDFLSHLVVFALRLRNAGLSDRGLLVYLSEFLQGNVYGFGTQGHSTIYEETDTYSLGVQWAFAQPIPYSYQQMKDSIHSQNNSSKPKCCNPYDPLDPSLHTSSNDLVPPSPHVTDPKPPFEPSRDNPVSDYLLSSDAVFHTKFTAPVAKLNPYWLPWIMAQIVNDPLVYDNEFLRPHLDEVIRLYNDWEPKGKEKELEHRLEPLRSRL